MMELATILSQVSQYAGIAQKEDIVLLAPNLPALPEGWHPNGDDAAAIPQADGYSLLAMEGFLNAFVAQDPWFAGWCGVMVNISDIAAMGGHPRAVVNALWNHDLENARQIFDGMSAAAKTFGVPIIGGHTNLRANQPQLAVSILGHAKRLLSAFAARPGQLLVAAIDHRGAFRKPYLNWNAATDAPAERLRGDIALLPAIAERELAFAAKDISQAGLLGTALMLLESSGVGARIDLDALPKPATVNWSDWLCAFPSFGYLLTTDSARLPELLELFHHREISAAAIGEITANQQLWVAKALERQLFRDLRNTPLTGFSPHPRAPQHAMEH
ncbi:methanogenesis marker 2 protein [Marinobacterium nitratireducens]|uniref:Methanogenesis marker 2 protein n=1 Tax=Marinobacterium nitratireducens TaxID=518897 RepID=A0A917ZKB6_9GAMM|nr:sll0787 family AIR synthase-like protein [Marinobacterium nitratireducens]GGO85334.1 methanogenesis marker 2 protein [Marinobacterium nitratireducens]